MQTSEGHVIAYYDYEGFNLPTSYDCRLITSDKAEYLVPKGNTVNLVSKFHSSVCCHENGKGHVMPSTFRNFQLEKRRMCECRVYT